VTESMNSQLPVSFALIPVIIAFVTTLVAMPVIRVVALRCGFVDRPGELKIHTSAIPRLGGAALVAGLGLAMGLAPAGWRLDNALLLVLGITWLLGICDDIRSIPAIIRLAIQLMAGSLVWLAGAGLQISGNGLVDLAITALFFSFSVNAWNLLDGMDGLALSVAAVAALGFASLFYIVGYAAGLLLALVTFSVSAAGLFYNKPPASIFIGDSGSTLLGAIFAILSLSWVHEVSSERSLLVPLLVVAIPLCDALAAMIRRVRGGKSPLSGDRSHFYDLLLGQNWTVRLILTVSAAATACLAALGVIVARGIVDAGWTAFAAATAICVLGALMGSFARQRNEIERRSCESR